jgi:hypothetical protein
MPKVLKRESYYLKGTAGDQINTLLAAAAYNMKKPTCLS